MYLGHGWHSLATALADAMWYASLYLVRGSVAMGSCWYGGEEGYRAWQDWEREARSRRRERRVERAAARGLTQIEHFLGNQAPSPGRPSSTKKASGTDRRRRRPPTGG